jgi:acetyltransferase-like isoleucine patch superfamily enzyme
MRAQNADRPSIPESSSLEKLFRGSFLWGGFLTMRWALRGVRFHPGSRIFGAVARVRIGPGARIRSQVTLRTSGEGRIELGARTWLADGVGIDTDRVVSIGAETTVQARSLINGSVTIGRGCLLAPGVFASSGGHVFRQWPALPIRIQERRAFAEPGFADRFDRPVTIEDDCWIGVNAVISPGVTVGKGAVIGANAVVTGEVAPYGVVGGVPARLLSKRLEWQPPRQLDATSIDAIPYLCGFDLRVDGNEVSAMLDGDAAIALEAAATSRVEVVVEANDATSVIVGTERHAIGAGRTRLIVAGVGAFTTSRFGLPHLRLPIIAASPNGPAARLLAVAVLAE